MEIKYLGHSSFLIKSKDSRLVTDPYDVSIGLKFPKIEADIVTVSHQHQDHNQSSLVDGSPLIIDMPGEFEKKDFRIFGYQSYHDKKKGEERGLNIIYKLEAESISVLHCGDLGEVLDDDFVESIGKVDICMIPVGGFYTINEDEAIELVKKIEPLIVIPMHYHNQKLNQETFGKLTKLEDFMKKMGAESVVPLPKFSIKKEELGEEMRVVSLEITS